MKLRVRLFAAAREAASADQIEIDLPCGATVADVPAALAAEAPTLAPFVERSLLAVNSEYAAPQSLLREDDEVALIPPVSGG